MASEMDLDWGVMDDSEIFSSSFGKTRPLLELIDQLDQSSLPSTSDFPQANPFAPVEVIPAPVPVALPPKILKKRNSLPAESPAASIRRVTFEVEKLVAEEAYEGEAKQDAEARLAIRLGALPNKNKPLNYKELKMERTTKKLTASLNQFSGLIDGKVTKKKRKMAVSRKQKRKAKRQRGGEKMNN